MSLTEWRICHGYTLKDLAALLGITVSMVSQYESGARSPSPKTAKAMIELGIPEDVVVSILRERKRVSDA